MLGAATITRKDAMQTPSTEKERLMAAARQQLREVIVIQALTAEMASDLMLSNLEGLAKLVRKNSLLLRDACNLWDRANEMSEPPVETKKETLAEALEAFTASRNAGPKSR